MKLRLLLCGVLLAALAAFAEDASALKDAVVLIIRHAEKPESGEGLSPVGMERATNYVNYFNENLMPGDTETESGSGKSK